MAAAGVAGERDLFRAQLEELQAAVLEMEEEGKRKHEEDVSIGGREQQGRLTAKEEEQGAAAAAVAAPPALPEDGSEYPMRPSGGACIP